MAALLPQASTCPATAHLSLLPPPPPPPNQVDKRQEEAKTLDQRIQDATRELRNLVLYRESGQYELRRSIFRLRDALSKLRQRQATETKNVTREADHLRDSLLASWRDMAQAVRDSASHSILQALAPPVRAKALENMSARQELVVHRAEHDRLTARIAALEKEQQQLRRDVAALERHRGSQLTSRAPYRLVRELPHVAAGVRDLALDRDGDEEHSEQGEAHAAAAAAAAAAVLAAAGSPGVASAGDSPRGASPAHGVSPTRYRVHFAQGEAEVVSEQQDRQARSGTARRSASSASSTTAGAAAGHARSPRPQQRRRQAVEATAAAPLSPSLSPARGAFAGTRAALASPSSAVAADAEHERASLPSSLGATRYVPVAMALGVGPTARQLVKEAEDGSPGHGSAGSHGNRFKRQTMPLPGLGEASQRTKTFMQQLQG